MPAILRQWVEAIWYPNTHQYSYARPFRVLLFVMLLPFSLLYSLLSLLIQYTTALKQGICPGYRSPVPVIVVGNFTVGGTGKTPLVAYLSDKLQEQGFRPGIISRGYGRNTTGTMVVTADSSPTTVGDEVALLFGSTHRPIVVSNNRNTAIQVLLSAFPAVDVIISDDGLQHARLQADYRISVVDSERGFGNGWCLPAGPLRAPKHWGPFSQVDTIIINETKKHISNTALDLETFTPNIYSMHVEAMGFVKLTPGNAYHSNLEIVPISTFIQAHQGKQIQAVAGIGNPARFFTSLENMGLSITRHVYPDHHNFKSEDLIFRSSDLIIMTEKDAIKCAPWLSHGDCWALKIRVTIEEQFSRMVGQQIGQLQRRRRST